MRFIAAFMGPIALTIAIGIIATILYFNMHSGSTVAKTVKDPTERIERSEKEKITDRVYFEEGR